MPSTTLSFTPYTALAGGLLLGVATVGKLAISGRILGVSGAFKGLVRGHIEAWRLSFIAGLCVAGSCAVRLGALDGTAVGMVSQMRVVLAGALVGFGAAMGRGCTSGHGIVGNSRLSPRSMAYTLTFMGTGAVVATVMETNKALGVVSSANTLAGGARGMGNAQFEIWAQVCVASVCAFGATWYYVDHHMRRASSKVVKSGGKSKTSDEEEDEIAHPPDHSKRVIDIAVDGVAGLVFGLGLAISGMCSPAKVSGFLSVTVPSFDPSLMFVMGGAMLLTAPGIRWFKAHTGIHRPKASYNTFDFTKNKIIDKNLLIGGILFGSGWGLAGVCPGPAVVSALASPSVEINLWLAAFLFGTWIHEIAFP